MTYFVAKSIVDEAWVVADEDGVAEAAESEHEAILIADALNKDDAA